MSAEYLCKCGNDQYLQVWQGPLYKSGLDRIFAGVACTRCGLTSLHPPVTEADMEQAVARRGWEDVHLPRSSSLPLPTVRDRAKELFIDLIEKNVPAPGSLLDVGCGYGEMGARLIPLGYQVAGVEPCEPVAVEARKRGLEVFEATLEEWEDEGRRYDGILFSNVLEHVPDPLLALKKAASLLSDRGRVIIEVPNIERPKTSYRRAFQLVHLWYFCPASLGYLLGLAGLTVATDRVFPVDCFQTVARKLEPGENPMAADVKTAERVAWRLKRHRRTYYTSLQFAWRKIPGFRNRLIFGE
jgi:SAM-dependent methyltransferase